MRGAAELRAKLAALPPPASEGAGRLTFANLIGNCKTLHLDASNAGGP